MWSFSTWTNVTVISVHLSFSVSLILLLSFDLTFLPFVSVSLVFFLLCFSYVTLFFTSQSEATPENVLNRKQQPSGQIQHR